MQIDEAADQKMGAMGPPNAGKGKFLRNRKTGEIYVWNEAMARRGDLLEAVDAVEDQPSDADVLRADLKAMDFLSNPPPFVLGV